MEFEHQNEVLEQRLVVFLKWHEEFYLVDHFEKNRVFQPVIFDYLKYFFLTYFLNKKYNNKDFGIGL